MNKIRLLKDIDSLIGKPLVSALCLIRRKERRASGYPQKILVIRPGGIGDAVLLFPALKAIKIRFPQARVDVLCEKRNAGVIRLAEGIDAIYLYDRKYDLLTCIRNGYDLVIDTEQWHRLSAVVCSLTHAPTRIGFDTNERARLFTHRIPYSHDDYEVYSFLRLLEPLCPGTAVFDADAPFIDPGHISISHLPWPSGKEGAVVAIFPGASVPERRWGGDRFGEVAGALREKGHGIVVLGSAGDTDDARRIGKYAPESVDLTGRTSLGEAAAVMKRCGLLITADSGLMHLAYAVGTPTVSLFGSGIEKKWAPRGRDHVVINRRLNCSPCTLFGTTPPCGRATACLSSIGVDEVKKAAFGVLGGNRI